MKKKFISVCVIALLLLAGCGGSSEPQQGTSSSSDLVNSTASSENTSIVGESYQLNELAFECPDNITVSEDANGNYELLFPDGVARGVIVAENEFVTSQGDPETWPKLFADATAANTDVQNASRDMVDIAGKSGYMLSCVVSSNGQALDYRAAAVSGKKYGYCFIFSGNSDEAISLFEQILDTFTF